MSLLDVDDNVNNVPEFKIGDIVKQYLIDINGFVDSRLPFEYLPPITEGKYYEPESDNVLVRDNSFARYYHVDAYYFRKPKEIYLDKSWPTGITGIYPANVTVITAQASPGIHKRVTWGWIKKHFNLE